MLQKAILYLENKDIENLLNEYYNLVDFEKKVFLFLFNEINCNSHFDEINQIIKSEIDDVFNFFKENPNREEVKKIVHSITSSISPTSRLFYKETTPTDGIKKIGESIEFSSIKTTIKKTENGNTQVFVKTNKNHGTLIAIGINKIDDKYYLIRDNQDNNHYSIIEKNIYI